MNIKPIETQYKGYRFRSRLEARWAVFFDALGIEWEYEKEGYDLGDGLKYLPDFWFPQVKMWGEVKPDKFSRQEKRKAAGLVIATNSPVLMLIGPPDFINYYALEKDPWIDESKQCRGIVVGWDYSLIDRYLNSEHRFPCSNYCPDNQLDCWPDNYHMAIGASRAARFEFGEVGYA